MVRLAPAALLALGLLFIGVGLAASGADLRPGPGAAVEPIRLSSRLFGEPVTLEIRDLPAETGDAAVRAAFARLEELEELLAAAVERLNSRAEEERAVAVEPPVADLLARALEFCAWSRSAHGPLGGSLAAYWTERAD
ncbi:MAG TPA: hypothetical protein VM599_11645, partial [Thermoanaerobaculia bacterium]|nr:hypothetical protein [Thermoanaerobaculia bacterium]